MHRMACQPEGMYRERCLAPLRKPERPRGRLALAGAALSALQTIRVFRRDGLDVEAVDWAAVTLELKAAQAVAWHPAGHVADRQQEIALTIKRGKQIWGALHPESGTNCPALTGRGNLAAAESRTW